MFKISKFSELTNISPRMLRHYDKLDLLKPSIIDEENGYRYYTADQINLANRILSLKNIGIPLKKIPFLLENEVAQNSYLSKQRTILETELAEKRLQLAYLDLLTEKRAASANDAVNLPIETKFMHKKPVLSYRQTVTSYYQENELWEKLFSAIPKEDFAELGPSIAVFHNKENEPIDIEVMIGLSEKAAARYPNVTSFEPNLVASIVTNGAYSTMPTIHDDMATWLTLNEYVLADPIFNIYHSSPATEEREELFITEVCYPIKKVIHYSK
ncbi:MerR family transcriptional regulator [Enterococcus wangshanyuanii]|uniref:MerR family transcriptional regulator n=1 Tax=Enterococcus wangshanyuanii TaxID=2005703 RepID=A0ABQ1P5L8_9ENTE|nr:MerR family transcriptional regulator [Enterococcus wangshanyuanii]GGC91069.1 MerR family transcriptional regulator [Enterococcus wangshanyuanii]